MSAKSPVVLSSSPSSPSLSLPSICSPLRKRLRRKSDKNVKKNSYLERFKSTRTDSIIGKTLARLRKSRARRRVFNVDEDQVVPNVNPIDLVVYPNPLHQNIPAPRLGFSVLALNPPPTFAPQHPAPPPPIFPAEDQPNHLPLYAVTIKSATVGDTSVTYYIRANETFQRVYYDYASKTDRYVHEILIFRNCEYVDMAHTPLGVGLVNGETLFVIPQNPEHNLNTKVKHFYIRDHRTHPLRLKVKGDLAAPLDGLYALWGEAANVNPDRLIVSHENNILTTFHTVSDAGIKNEQEVFVLYLNNNYNPGV